jgi:hypothetical protein
MNAGNRRERRPPFDRARCGKGEFMKKVLLPAAVLFIALMIAAGLGAADAPAKRVVSGEVVSLYAYVAQGRSGPDQREIGVFQVEKHGLPLAIVESETGDIYVAVGKGPSAVTAKLVPLMGLKVNALGPVWEKAGLKLIEVEVVSEQ